MIERAAALAERAAKTGSDDHVRQAASGLYHITTAVGFAHEAATARLPHRLALAQLVLAHRLEPRDPLAGAADAKLIDSVLDGAAMA